MCRQFKMLVTAEVYGFRSRFRKLIFLEQTINLTSQYTVLQMAHKIEEDDIKAAPIRHVGTSIWEYSLNIGIKRKAKT